MHFCIYYIYFFFHIHLGLYTRRICCLYVIIYCIYIYKQWKLSLFILKGAAAHANDYLYFRRYKYICQGMGAIKVLNHIERARTQRKSDKQHQTNLQGVNVRCAFQLGCNHPSMSFNDARARIITFDAPRTFTLFSSIHTFIHLSYTAIYYMQF